MPVYEYRCHGCGQIVEALQKMSDPPLTDHTCGGSLERILSVAAFHFKGAGFYATDYSKVEPTDVGLHNT